MLLNTDLQNTLARQTLQTINESLLIIDPYADRLLMSNVTAQQHLGYSESDLSSLSVSQLFKHCIVDLINFTDQVLTQQSGWSLDLCCCHRDGHPLQIEVSACAIRINEQSLLAMLIRDRRQLKKQEQKARADNYIRRGLGEWQQIEEIFQEIERENQLLLQAVGDGIYGVNASGQTTFLNPAAEQMLGWQAEEVVGKDIHTLIHHTHADGDHYHVEDCPIYAAFHDGAVHRVDNEIFWRKDGTAFPVEYTSTPVTDHGRLVGAVVIFRDITERKETEHNLHAALEEVNQLKLRLEQENAYLQEEIRSEYNYKEIVGKSTAIQRTIHQIQLVAPTEANVLISGESGTGKELIARAIHESSGRSERPLIRVNCAAIPRELFESEFFGHVKGAFTGATGDRAGRFELADGGTLFLDEVGEIPVELQGKLLRVLQEGQFERVGDSRTRKVNVRIIAATNRDLLQAVRKKLFREDLYFRLNVFPVESAALRERQDDIPLLASHFLNHARQKLNKPQVRLTQGDIRRLADYRWPGNIRELENVIERAVILSRGDRLSFDLPVPNTTPYPMYNPPVAREEIYAGNLMTCDELRVLEINNIRLALQKSKGRIFGQTGAAELLNMKPTTLASRIKRLGIEKNGLQAEAHD
ncbi:sigma 54-interacting transcriptional regulator [Thiohalophilus sp.]|uniref:sigma 54-interacting transcriptional regulator n=1 Tax=Thiohalophilus sp. TaxID=3028392 RepID=UPI0039747F72